MQILRDPPQWNSDAAGLLKEFLESTVGQVFLANLAAGRPDFSTSNEVAAVGLRGKEIEGYEKCIRMIIRLTEAPEEIRQTESNPYPDINDDEKWKTTTEAEP